MLETYLVNVESYLLQAIRFVKNVDSSELLTTSSTSFALIAAAEIGDKSQLVCMTLASKYKAWPIVLGAASAFALLNGLAVVFGVVISSWLPDAVVAAAVAVLFTVFGIGSLLSKDGGDEDIKEKSGHGVFMTTFLLITLAEFGDKTQLTVVGLSSASSATAVWLGATAALASTSALGVIAGRAILQKIPLAWLHRISGLFFLSLAAIAGYKAFTSVGQQWLADYYGFLRSKLMELMK